MGPAKIDIEKLRASDFPGLDEAKFKEWQELQIKLMRRVKIVWNYAFPVLLVLYPIIKGKTISHGFFELDWTGMYFFLVLFFLLGNAIYTGPLLNRLRPLEKELKMRARLRAKRKGQVFTG